MTNISRQFIQQRRIRLHALGDLEIAPPAQREFKQAWADFLLSIFDPDGLETPHVSIRDGRKFIVDGQHGLDALKRWLGAGWETQKIECWTYEGLTLHEEARLFIYLNRNRKRIPAIEDFRIALTGQFPIETDIDRIVRANGQTVGPQGISAVGTLKKAYTRSDPNTFGMMIRINEGAFGLPGFESVVIDGVSQFCQRYNGQIEEARAIRKLADYPKGVKGLINKAYAHRERMDQPLGQCLAAEVVETYNKGNSQKLPKWWT
jgi:hypothetical protein